MDNSTKKMQQKNKEVRLFLIVNNIEDSFLFFFFPEEGKVVREGRPGKSSGKVVRESHQEQS